MFFPSHKNQKYCSHECYLGKYRKPLSPRTCPICKRIFIPKRANHKYCCPKCSSRAYYLRRVELKKPKIEKAEPKPQPPKNKPNHFQIKNPIATIQGIEVRYTTHINNDKEGNDELIWFLQELKNRNLDLEIVKERGKVSDILLFNGYEVKDARAFDKAFKQVMKMKLV